MQLLRDPPANILSNPRGAAGKVRTVRDIQIGLIQRQRLDQFGVVTEDRLDLARHGLVGIHPRLDDQQVRAQLQRMPGGHGRTHPVGTGLVIARSDHPATIRSTAHRQRFACQARIVTHLDGGIEAVAIDVDDFSLIHKVFILLV
ncbi:hypothetical protein D3C84_300240 [compost metagenome]